MAPSATRAVPAGRARLVLAVLAGLVVMSGPAAWAAPAGTGAAAPPNPPRRVGATTGAGRVAVTWVAPSPGGSAVSGFAVGCSSTDGGPALSGSAAATALGLTLTGLPDDRTYACTVRATGPAGTSAPARSPYVMHARVSTPGGKVTMRMPIAAGQGVSAAAAGSTLPADCSSTLTTAGPAGPLTIACLPGSSVFVDGRDVAAAGRATVTLQAGDGRTGSAELKAWVYRDGAGPITVDGPPVRVTTTSPGQNAVRSFSVAGPGRVSVDITGNGVPGVTVAVRDPAGTTLAVLSTGADRAYLDTVSLPSAGTYSILADPTDKAAGSLTLQLHRVAPDSTGSLRVNGPAVKVTVTSPGQNGVRTFAGSAGQRVTLEATANTVPTVTCSIRTAGGTTLAVFSTSSSTGTSAPVTLPGSGTYQVFVDPDQRGVGSVLVRVRT